MPIELSSFLLPRNGNDFHLMEDVYLKGGMRCVDSRAYLYAVRITTLKPGMIVYIIDEDVFVRFVGPVPSVVGEITSAHWQELSLENRGKITSLDSAAVPPESIVNIYISDGSTMYLEGEAVNADFSSSTSVIVSQAGRYRLSIELDVDLSSVTSVSNTLRAGIRVTTIDVGSGDTSEYLSPLPQQADLEADLDGQATYSFIESIDVGPGLTPTEFAVSFCNNFLQTVYIRETRISWTREEYLALNME